MPCRKSIWWLGRPFEANRSVLGVSKLLPSGDGRPEWNVAMAGAVIVMIPPIAVVLVLQRLFVKGLIESDK